MDIPDQRNELPQYGPSIQIWAGRNFPDSWHLLVCEALSTSTSNFHGPNSLGETVVVGRLVEEADCGIVPLKLTTLSLARGMQDQ